MKAWEKLNKGDIIYYTLIGGDTVEARDEDVVKLGEIQTMTVTEIEPLSYTIHTDSERYSPLIFTPEEFFEHESEELVSETSIFFIATSKEVLLKDIQISIFNDID